MSINKDWTKEDNFDKFESDGNRRAKRRLSQHILASLVMECPRVVGKALERLKNNLSDEEKELLKTIDLNSGYEKQMANDMAKEAKTKNANVT